MFNFFKKKVVKAATKNIVASCDGKLIDITTVNDPTFAEKMMGDGYAIIPSNGDIVAPIDGVVSVMFPTGHAFGIMGDNGIEMLVHIGIDTVTMEGKGFKTLAKQGDHVSAGDILVKVDLNAVKEAGFESTTMNIFTGGFNKTTDELKYNSDVKAGDIIFNID